MHLNGLLEVLEQTQIFEQVLESIQHDEPIPDQNLLRSARPFFAFAALERK